MWAYAFPATSLDGFVAEQITTIYAPFKVACQIIRSQPGICHIIIYALDHYKALRRIEAVEFAGKMVD